MSHYINYESGRHGDLNKTLTNIGSPSGFLSFFFNVHPLKRKNTQAYNDISSLVSSSSHSSFFLFLRFPVHEKMLVEKKIFSQKAKIRTTTNNGVVNFPPSFRKKKRQQTSRLSGRRANLGETGRYYSTRVRYVCVCGFRWRNTQAWKRSKR
jgi:hypothetical protein